MARSSVKDFRRELPALAVPPAQESNAPEIARAQSGAQVSAANANLNANLDVFGMGVDLVQNTAVSAAKGQIEWQLDRLQDHGDVAKANALELQELGSHDSAVDTSVRIMEKTQAITDATNDPTGTIPDDPAKSEAIAAELGQIDRQKRKLQQGILTREQVLTNISKIVKTFSQAAPGWATDFRKAAANATGISTVDTYGIHKALTQASARELALAAQAKAQAKYIERVAINAGKDPANLTQQDADDYEQEAQMENQSKRIEHADQLAEQTQIMQDSAGDQLMGVYGAINLAKISKAFDTVMTSARTSGSGDKAASMAEFHANALDFNTQLAEMQGGMEQQLKALKAPSLDPNGRKWHISQEKYDKLNAEMKQSFETYRSYFKDAEKFNEFAGLVKAAKGNAEYMAHMMTINHPLVASLQRIGLADPLFKQWVSNMALGKTEGEAVFTKRFGPGMFKAISGFMNEDHGKWRWGKRQKDTQNHLEGKGNPAKDALNDTTTTQVDLASHKMTWENYMAKPEKERTRAEAIQIWKQLPTLLGVNPDNPSDRSRNVLFMSREEAALLIQPLQKGAFQAAYNQLEGKDKANADKMLARMIPQLRSNYVTTITDMVTQMAKNSPEAKLLWDPDGKRFHVMGLSNTGLTDGNALVGDNESYNQVSATAFSVAQVMDKLQALNPETAQITREQLFKDVVDRLSDSARNSLTRLDTLAPKLEIAKEKEKLSETELHATTGPHTGRQSPERIAAAQALRRSTAEVAMLKQQIQNETDNVAAVKDAIPRWGVPASTLRPGQESSIALRNRTGAAADPRNEIDEIQAAANLDSSVARDPRRTVTGKIKGAEFPSVTRPEQVTRDKEALRILKEEFDAKPTAELKEEIEWQVLRTKAETEAWTVHQQRRQSDGRVELPAPKNMEDKQAPSPSVAELQGRGDPNDEVTDLKTDVIAVGPGPVVAEVAGLKDPTYGSHIKALTKQIQLVGHVLIDAFTEADQLKWKNYIDVLDNERRKYQALRDN